METDGNPGLTHCYPLTHNAEMCSREPTLITPDSMVYPVEWVYPVECFWRTLAPQLIRGSMTPYYGRLP